MRTLPDHLRKGMKLVIIGCHPTESSVRVGHYYAGRDNEFWPLIFESGVVPEPFDYRDDKRVIEFGIGSPIWSSARQKQWKGLRARILPRGASCSRRSWRSLVRA